MDVRRGGRVEPPAARPAGAGPTGLPGRRLVTGTFRHGAGDVYDLALADGSPALGTTGNHPFWSYDRQAFIPAAELRVGERLQRPDGGPVAIASVTRRALPESVFNLEIDVEHVYFVGTGGVLVHNQCHHIVSIYDNLRRPEAAAAIMKSRAILTKANIDIKSALNVRNVEGHIAKQHSISYHKMVASELGKAAAKSNNPEKYSKNVEDALTRIFNTISLTPSLMY